VGFSAERARQSSSSHAGPEECNDDLDDLLTLCSDGDTRSQWILIGPSMGAVMAACYIAAHPERVVGYLNVDGIPATIAYKRGRFEFVRCCQILSLADFFRTSHYKSRI
jgi:pimeloyl-ACP methyl ester carboxylesterase